MKKDSFSYRMDIDSKKDQVILDYASGLGSKKLSKKYGCHYNTILRRLVKWGISIRKGLLGRIHGLSTHPMYNGYRDMISRCHNTKHTNYNNYGGRGIFVCQRWLDSFEYFLADMGERPPNKTLDRINNDGPYCKSNCRWATQSEQNLNRRPQFCLENYSDDELTKELDRRGILVY